MCGISGLGTALVNGLTKAGQWIATGATKLGTGLMSAVKPTASSAHSIGSAISNTAPSATSLAGNASISGASTVARTASSAKNLGAIAGIVGTAGALGTGLMSMRGTKGTNAQQYSILDNTKTLTPAEQIAETVTSLRKSDVNKIQRSLGALRIKQNNANSVSGVNTSTSALNLNLGG